LTTDAAASSRDSNTGFFRQVEDSARVLVHLPASVGERDATGFPTKQRCLQDSFQLLNALADRCLSDLEMASGGREATAFGGFDEG
jgi:hypothetical protein